MAFYIFFETMYKQAGLKKFTILRECAVDPIIAWRK